MTHSGTRARSFLGCGLLAMVSFLAGGAAAVYQKEKPSEPGSEPTTQPSSTETDISSTSSKTGTSEPQISNTPMAQQRARKMVAKRAHCPDDEYMLLDELGLM